MIAAIMISLAILAGFSVAFAVVTQTHLRRTRKLLEDALREMHASVEVMHRARAEIERLKKS